MARVFLSLGSNLGDRRRHLEAALTLLRSEMAVRVVTCSQVYETTPWPVLGDQLIIRKQLYEIVQLDEDDIGEFGFRLIRQEIGISTVTSEGAVSNDPVVQPLAPSPNPAGSPKGRPDSSATPSTRAS